MSSRNAITNLSKSSLKTAFIRHMKTTGAFKNPKIHHSELIMLVPCFEGSLVDVFFFNNHLLISISEINI
jgi:hypothetical protein